MKTKKILIFSAGRSDFDRLLPMIDRLNKVSFFKLKVVLGHAHLNKDFGYTLREIEKINTINIIKLSRKKIIDKKYNIALNLSRETYEMTTIFEREKPDAVMVLGDRHDILACVPAIIFNIPIIHIYGGAVTLGAIDEQVRHAFTKLSHLHLVATDKYRKRILQLGEEFWRVKNIGVPELGYLKKQKILNINKISEIVGLNLAKKTILCTYHVETLAEEETKKSIDTLLSALKDQDYQVIFTYGNTDYNHSVILNKIKNFIKKNNKPVIKFVLVKNTNLSLYSNLLFYCSCMIGNSSSGIVESTVFKTPSISIGLRQVGKEHDVNVIFTKNKKKNILQAVKYVNSKNFYYRIKKMKNIYKYNNLKNFSKYIINFLNQDLVMKKFFIDR